MDAPGVDRMWKSTTYEDTFVSIFTHSSDFILTDFLPVVYVKGLPEVREFIHGMVGIKNYRITKSESSRGSDGWVIKVQGDYLRQGTLPIFFCEVHRFTETAFTQRQLLVPVAESKKLFGSGDCFAALEEVTR